GNMSPLNPSSRNSEKNTTQRSTTPTTVPSRSHERQPEKKSTHAANSSSVSRPTPTLLTNWLARSQSAGEKNQMYICAAAAKRRSSQGSQRRKKPPFRTDGTGSGCIACPSKIEMGERTIV